MQATIRLSACLLLLSSAAIAEPLSLGECMETARINSPAVAAAEQSIFSAREGLLGSWGAFLPTFSGNLGYNHQFVGPKPASLQYNTITQEFFTQEAIASRDYETYSFGLSGSWTLFSGFAGLASLRAGELGLDASRFDLKDTINNLERDIIRGYYNLVQAQMLVELNASSMDASRESYRQVVRAFQMGAVARTDTLNASVRFAETRLALLESENSRSLAALNLATMMGLPPTSDIRVAGLPLDGLPDFDPSSALDAAIAHNPALEAARARYAAAEQGIRLAASSRWPSLIAGYSYSWYDLSPPEDAGQLFREDYGYSLSLGLRWMLFDGFQTRQRTNQARAAARIQEYGIELSRRGLLRSIESYLMTLDNSRKRIELARATIALAREELRLARERYRVGAATYLEISEAEVSLIRARISEIDGVTNYLTAIADLQRSTGWNQENDR